MSVRPPQIFQVKAKMLTIRSVFPDFLSISYNHEKNYEQTGTRLAHVKLLEVKIFK